MPVTQKLIFNRRQSLSAPNLDTDENQAIRSCFDSMEMLLNRAQSFTSMGVWATVKLKIDGKFITMTLQHIVQQDNLNITIVIISIIIWRRYQRCNQKI